MTGTASSSRTWIGTILFLAACAALVFMGDKSASRNALMIPAAIGWVAAFYTLFPMVSKDRRSSLYFAFGIMAFLIYFLHETYGYHDKSRYFPVLIGWAGVALATLDIVSVTETRAAHVINTIFGGELSEPPGKGLRVSREIACLVAISMSVVLIWLFGFLIASPVFVFLWMWLWGRKRILLSLYVAVFTFLFIWVLFQVLFQYDLYHGIVVQWFMDRIQG